VADQTTTIGSAAITIFRDRQNRRTWVAHRPLLQLLASDQISQARIDNKLKLTPINSTVGKAQAYKWYLGTTAPTGGGSFAPGASFTFSNQFNSTFGVVNLRHYEQPVAFPSSLIDVHIPARDNENGINVLVRLLEDAKKQMFDRIARHIVQTSPAATDIDTLVGTGTTSGVLGDGITVGAVTTYGIDSSVETSHRSIVHDLGGGRLTLRRLAKDIRDARRNRNATLDVVVMGSAVHDMLVQEAEALNLPYFDIVENFGKDPKTGEPHLYLETSHSVLKNEGSVLLVDTDLDVTAPNRALGLSLGEMSLDAGEVNNMTVKGWKDVALEDATDQIRAQIRLDVMNIVFDRSKFVVWTNLATS